MADNVELVRRLWSAFERGGIEAVLEITDPDVEGEPYGGGRGVVRGGEGPRAGTRGRRDRKEAGGGGPQPGLPDGGLVGARRGAGAPARRRPTGASTRPSRRAIRWSHAARSAFVGRTGSSRCSPAGSTSSATAS